MGLLVMILGLVLLLGVHMLSTQRELRARLIASMGEGVYKTGYALASLAGLALIVWGFAHYRATGWIEVWTPPTALKHVAVALMLPAVILVVASYVRGRIYTALKHPMLAGVKLWALAHLLANGRPGDVLLFGAFLAWAVIAFIAARRRDRAAGTHYAPGSASGDALVLTTGLSAWALFAFYGHAWLIGVRPFG